MDDETPIKCYQCGKRAKYEISVRRGIWTPYCPLHRSSVYNLATVNSVDYRERPLYCEYDGCTQPAAYKVAWPFLPQFHPNYLCKEHERAAMRAVDKLNKANERTEQERVLS